MLKTLNKFWFILGLWCCVSGRLSAAPPSDGLGACNVVWNSPGADASGSMPIGNGEVGLNVWVEPNGDLLFYVARTDTWSECCRLLKLGRVRIHLSPNPFTDHPQFRQELRLRDGQIVIEDGDVTLCVFVDADAPVIYVDGTSLKPHTVTATWETWRTNEHVLTGEELSSSWTMRDAPSDIKVWESADIVTNSAVNAVTAWHRNAYSVVPLTLKHQGLESISNLIHDPLLNRTLGARMSGPGFVSDGSNALKTAHPVAKFDLSIATHTAQTTALADWEKEITQPVSIKTAARRTTSWWNQFWNRSWISVRENGAVYLPTSSRPLQLGADSNGDARFTGEITNALALERVLSAAEIAGLAQAKPDSQTNRLAEISLRTGFTLAAWIKPAPNESGRIFDKITAFGGDGFMFDTYPGLSLRLNVGGDYLSERDCLKADEWQHVAATVDAQGNKRIYLNGKLLKQDVVPDSSASQVTQAYVLQRWMTACAGRGNYPVKFNGSIFTVDAKFAGGPDLSPDWRRWGDCYWWQNMRFPCYPVMATGDFEEAHPLFHAYEEVLPLCRARAKLYYEAEGAYFPETMTIFGTYANADYSWNRGDHPAGEILNPWWRYAWQQGLELTALMLDYYEYTGDKKFLQQELIPIANAALRYYDTRFQRDAHGKLIISPTQVVETYRDGVLNDTPSVAGLTDVCERLLRLPASRADREFWERMKNSIPAVPLQDGRILPAEKFGSERSNIENPELYAVWPFRLYGIGHSDPEIAVQTFRHRTEQDTIGWQYDGQCAALAGLTDDASSLLLRKVRNSNSSFRFPAMWGPNYDWLPDQDHGANIMLTLQNMILQSVGDKIYVLPAWPEKWDVNFKLHAPQRTVIEGVYKDGQLKELKVSPESRRKDVKVLLPGTQTTK